MTELNFKEKSAWGTLVALLVLGGLYFSSVVNLWRADRLELPAVFGLGVGFTVLLVVTLVVHHILIACRSKPEIDDERDRVIAWRAGHIGGVVLGVGVVAVVVQIVIGGMIGHGFAFDFAHSPALISVALITALWLATVIELALTIRFYRRGP